MLLTKQNFNPETNQPEVASRSADILLDVRVQEAFPLFGPIREKDWAEGWEPVVRHGAGVVEEKMIFQTKGSYRDEPDYTWIVSKYFPDRYLIKYTVISSNRVWFITVQCNPVGLKTRATIRYSYHGFTPIAIQRNHESIQQMFASNLNDWEVAINYFLKTGKKFS